VKVRELQAELAKLDPEARVMFDTEAAYFQCHVVEIDSVGPDESHGSVVLQSHDDGRKHIPWSLDETIEAGLQARALTREELDHLNEIYAPRTFDAGWLDPQYLENKPQFHGIDLILQVRRPGKFIEGFRTMIGQYDPVEKKFKSDGKEVDVGVFRTLPQSPRSIT